MKTPTQIADTVQAALYFVQYTKSNISQYYWACDIIQREITDEDKEQVCPRLAAAARILADEILRLQKELNTQPQ